MSWILQFDAIDYDIAIRIIKNLNVVGVEDMNLAFSVAYSKLMRHAQEKGRPIHNDNTLYVTFGSAAKSGSVAAYNFRCINGLSSEYFLTESNLQLVKEGKIKNLVLIDDIIGTGTQSSKLLNKVSDKARCLNINDIYVITAIGFSEGINRIRETQVADVFAAIEYGKEDTVVSFDSPFYCDLPYEKRIGTLDKLTNKYKGIGYNKQGALIVFYYNTPNNTIQSVWSENQGWIPLFARKTDLSIDGPELYTLDELLENDEIKQEVINKPECNIYVEGKFEEMFVQELANQHDNFGYKSLNIISVGPFFNQNLIDTLKDIADKVFFITTEAEDSNTAHAKNILENTKGVELTRMNDVMSYFSIDKIKESPSFVGVIDWQSMEGEDDKDVLVYLETKLFKNQYLHIDTTI